MIKINITNFTTCSNLAIYLGAYSDKISNIAILDINHKKNLLYIIPYLKQIGINYQVYTHLTSFIEDKKDGKKCILMLMADDISFDIQVFKLFQKNKTDIIIVTSMKNKFIEENISNCFFVKINSPNTNQLTYLYQTNLENISVLKKLNYYESISVV